MYEDKTLICKDCHKEFVFTAGEQEFYAEKGFVNEFLMAVFADESLVFVGLPPGEEGKHDV